MKKLIRKILKEETNNKFIDKIMKYIKLPYLKNMGGLGLSKKEYKLVLSRIFNQPVTIKGKKVYDNQGNIIYYEDSDGYWVKKIYNGQGKLTYEENSYGFWEKYEYDNQGNIIYHEDSDGYWKKWEYDERGKPIYYEDADGRWIKYEYDSNGNQIYFENSYGEIEDNR